MPIAPPMFVTQAAVYLMGMQRIPGRCARVMKVESRGCLPLGVPVVFEPSLEWMKETGLEAELSLVELNAER